MPRKPLIQMNARAHKAMAMRWAIIGFECSGTAFNAQRMSTRKYKNLERLLLNYFDGVYEKEMKKK